MDALIQKMTLPDIWESWLKSSRGGTAESDPDSSDLSKDGSIRSPATTTC